MKPHIEIKPIALLIIFTLLTCSINAQQIQVEGAPGQNSIEVTESGFSGILIDSTLRHGMIINNTDLNGIYLTEIGQNGISIEGVLGNGVDISGVAGNSIEVSASDIGINLNDQQLFGIKISNPVNYGLSVYNSGLSGITVADAGTDGVFISYPQDDGLEITHAGKNGIDVSDPTNNGILIENAGNHGVEIELPQSSGITITDPGTFGIVVNDGGSGFLSSGPTQHGMQVINAGIHGVSIDNAGHDGINIKNSNSSGINISNSSSNGIFVSNSTNKGIWVKESGSRGIEIQDAGSDGAYITNSQDNGITIHDAGKNGVRILDPMESGITVYGANEYSGYFNCSNASTHPAVLIDHGNPSMTDLAFADDALIRASDDFEIEMDSDNGQSNAYFEINRSLAQGGNYSLKVYESGNSYFRNNVDIIGNISKGSGTFKIDHPIDPENKYLYHSFVESPDMMNIYNGNVLLDKNGEAEVDLPNYFEALNRDFRYQLTSIGAPGPNLYISKEIENLSFSIAGGKAGSKVSWSITGIRQDPYANENRIEVEVEKQGEEKGKYLHPKAWEAAAKKSNLPILDQDIKERRSTNSIK